MKNISLIILVLLWPLQVYAGPFEIVNRDYGNANAALIAIIDELLDDLEDDVNDELPDADQSTYLKGMSNASVMSGKGAGTDYANPVYSFLLAYNISAGADLGDTALSDLISGDIDFKQVRGGAFQFNFLGGIDGKYLPFKSIFGFDTRRFDFFLNFGSRKSTSSDFIFTLKNYGCHVRYHWIIGGGLPYKMAYWRGVDFTFGYEYNDMRILLHQELNITETHPLGTASLSGIVEAGAVISTHSIPLELSTYFQWLYFFTTYLGLGVDLNFGETKSIAYANAPISANVVGVTGVSARGTIDLGEKGEPSLGLVRIFLGQQFNFYVVKLGVQADHALGTGLWGAAVSFKVTW